MSEYVSPSQLKRASPGEIADFSEQYLLYYASEMGVDPSELMVFCSRADAPEAHKAARNLGCTVVLVPNEIIKSDHWAVHHKQRHEFGMWSPGA